MDTSLKTAAKVMKLFEAKAYETLAIMYAEDMAKLHHVQTTYKIPYAQNQHEKHELEEAAKRWDGWVKFVTHVKKEESQEMIEVPEPPHINEKDSEEDESEDE